MWASPVRRALPSKKAIQGSDGKKSAVGRLWTAFKNVPFKTFLKGSTVLTLGLVVVAVVHHFKNDRRMNRAEKDIMELYQFKEEALKAAQAETEWEDARNRESKGSS